MEIALIALVAFLASLLTFFSGFGLGTLLTPVMMVFFPANIAIGLTGVVHFFNNLFKLVLVGRNLDKKVFLLFGVPAILAAFLGATVLLYLVDVEPLFSYEFFGKTLRVYPVKLIVSILLIGFAILDLIPKMNAVQFTPKWLPLGGVVSGFFGGLSGNQGALRTAFLIKAGLSKERFIGTTVVISSLVDITRLSVYASMFSKLRLQDNLSLLVVAILAAVTGAFLGNKLLKKVTLAFIQKLVAVMLICLSLALGAGLI